MNLTTSRLVIRPFKQADITDSYLSWLNDPEVTRFSNQRFREHNVMSVSAYFKSFISSNNSFLLLDRLDGSGAIGTATVYRDNNHGTADIGLMLGDRRCWGKGYGREAWTALLEALLSEPGLRKVTGGTARLNKGMVKIMEQSGMELEAVRSRQELIEGQPVDLLYFARFADHAA